MTIASIDLGSNSVILLKTEYNTTNGKLLCLGEYFTTPRISENILSTGIISEAAVARLEKVFEEFSATIKENNCEYVLINATNAFRIATNAEIVKAYLEKKFSWIISIISGEKEARLSYIGAVSNTYENTSSLLIDIGGGSTEFILGDGLAINSRKSIQLGVVSLRELYFSKIPTNENHIKSAESFILSRINALDIRIQNNTNVITVAGTPTTLSAIANNVKKYSNDLIDNTVLELDQIILIRERLINLSKYEMRLEFGNVVEGREDLIAGGSLILETIMKCYNIKRIRVSTKGLRYGAVYDYLKSNCFYTNRS